MDVVTVVVPSAGKRDQLLHRALDSIGGQSFEGPIAVVLVDDSRDGRLSDFGGSRGNAKVSVVPSSTDEAPRWTGVKHARADTAWFAFLDDDDWWVPRKLERQVQLALELRTAGHEPVVSCLVDTSGSPDLTATGAVPARAIAPGQNVAEYLFWRRAPSRRRSSIFTSTILTSRSIALAVPWRKLPRHQDWDWLVRAGAVPGVAVRHVPEVLVGYAVGSASSISATPDWQSSLAWAQSTLREYAEPAVYADFLASQTLRYAIAARSREGIAKCVREIRMTAGTPSPSALASGLAGLVSRRYIEAALRGRGRSTR